VHRSGVVGAYGPSIMNDTKAEIKDRTGAQPRASVTFPPNLYKAIRTARRKKVSIAWIVRDAVEKYVEDQWPLLAPVKGE
jgi:hypothetical protein